MYPRYARRGVERVGLAMYWLDKLQITTTRFLTEVHTPATYIPHCNMAKECETKKKEKNTRKREMYIYKLCQREEAEALVNVYLKSGCVVRTWAFAINERWLGQDHARVQGDTLVLELPRYRIPWDRLDATRVLSLIANNRWSTTRCKHNTNTHSDVLLPDFALLNIQMGGGGTFTLDLRAGIVRFERKKKTEKLKKKDNFGAKLYIIL